VSADEQLSLEQRRRVEAGTAFTDEAPDFELGLYWSSRYLAHLYACDGGDPLGEAAASDGGACDDCAEQVLARYRYAELELCRPCARRRALVARRLELEPRRPSNPGNPTEVSSNGTTAADNGNGSRAGERGDDGERPDLAAWLVELARSGF
jgi:hypothetical protein